MPQRPTARGGETGSTWAAIDVGSNTIHLLIARRERGRWVEVERRVEMAGFGPPVLATGEVGSVALEKAARIIEEMAQSAKATGATLLLGATHALRVARDQDAVVARLGKAAGVPCRMISGEEEATLSYLGARALLGLAPGQLFHLFDVGGGSSEWAYGISDEATHAVSIPLGSGSLTRRYLGDPPTLEEVEAAIAAARADLEDQLVGHDLGAGGSDEKNVVVAVTGGSAMTLARRAGDDFLDDAVLTGLRNEIIGVTAEERAHSWKIEPERAAVLGGGVALLTAVASIFPGAQLHVSREGIRLGMIVRAQISHNLA